VTPTCLNRSMSLVSGAVRLALFALTVVLAGCNVIALKQASIEHTMRDHGMASADVKLGSDTIHYWVGGNGPTVVLVHGFGASGMWLWYPQVADLAKDHRVIVPDLIWFGESRSDERDYTLDHQVHAVEALLDKLGERDIDIMGVSYGGLVAHELASDRASAVRHLVLVDTPGRVYRREDYKDLCQRMGVDHLAKVLVPRDGRGVQRLLALAYFDPPWIPGFALDQTLTSLYGTQQDERVALLDALLANQDALVARPVTLRASTMLVWGRDDQVFPLDIGQRLAASLHAPIRVIDHARHAPNLEHSDDFNQIVRGFLGAGG
jgi:pimeloyl-ACP methyl ester carboxylesterase